MCILVIFGEKHNKENPRLSIKIKDKTHVYMKATRVIKAKTDAMTNDTFHQTSILLRYK